MEIIGKDLSFFLCFFELKKKKKKNFCFRFLSLSNLLLTLNNKLLAGLDRVMFAGPTPDNYEYGIVSGGAPTNVGEDGGCVAVSCLLHDANTLNKASSPIPCPHNKTNSLCMLLLQGSTSEMNQAGLWLFTKEPTPDQSVVDMLLNKTSELGFGTFVGEAFLFRRVSVCICPFFLSFFLSFFHTRPSLTSMNLFVSVFSLFCPDLSVLSPVEHEGCTYPAT